MSPNVAASVRARLLNQAMTQREEFERTLVRYADERLLYRLGASAAREQCVLKGASLLTAWMPDPYRATRDVDVLTLGSPDSGAIRKIVEEICAVPCPDDGLRFDLSELVVEDIRAEEAYTGKRARFVAVLGTARIRLQMDFGLGDALVTGPYEIDYPTMLEGLPAPRLRAYPREATVAEKFEAMVSLDTRNSRMKDFHDVWALSSAFAFDGATLQRSIAACFERRRTSWSDELSRCLTSAFYQDAAMQSRWRNYLRAGAVLIAPPSQFERIGDRIIAFIGPVRHAILARESFDETWQARGTWSSASLMEKVKG